jgi:hypothetical protein
MGEDQVMNVCGNGLVEGCSVDVSVSVEATCGFQELQTSSTIRCHHPG